MTGSGEYDELYELMKIRVKIHCEGDVRGMALNPEVSFLEFKQRVAAKFETSLQSIMLKFRDEDGGKVSLRDESDYDLAIETARESAKGRPEGKLELWCEIK
jgi:neutrophil cytosolic factor 2